MSAKSPKRRVVLIGLGPTTLTALEGLVDVFDVVVLVRDSSDDTVARARELGVPVHEDASLRAVREVVKASQPDAVVVSSFNRILDAELVEQCPFINVHYAPLPRGRGRATVNWALINGDTETAISIHRIVPGLDAGGILFQAPVPIGPTSTVTTLYDELNELQRVHLAAAVAAAIAGDPGLEQDESKATYCCARTPADGEISWGASTSEIDRLIRALQDPFPPAFTWFERTRLEVLEAVVVVEAPLFEGRVPGRVVRVDHVTGSVDVLSGDGVVRLRRVRREGQVEVDAATVVRSTKSTLGLSTMDLLAATRANKPI